ncbi:PREDICTED: CSC1-like protein 2 [Nicrophorus vespilloides]|uniref:CSC1-like protein 2 n=1 Tax=Nicrophorus vespilloides TaxID=110193 RepID=A0ABM1MTF1_NICVS|nr:PREDICTED: CSC1-like protein 2 [Nicrophorus vespilloides]
MFIEYENDTCLNVKRINKTSIGNVYEGIPETLLLNFMSWCLLLVIFAILRNKAWDYGRLALVQSEKWTQLFYKNTDEAIAIDETNPETSLITDAGCSWFPTIFTINNQRIFARCGPDASHYLSFQKHLLILMMVISAVSIFIILPVNFQGTLQGNEYTFGHTTLSNLEPTSLLLWVHVIASFAFVPITVLIMRRCSSRIPSTTKLSSRTVMVTHISRSHRNEDDIKSYFALRYPTIQIKDVKIAYKIKRLMDIEKQRAKSHDARMYCLTNHEINMKLQPIGCIFCCPWKTVNALNFYSQEEERLTNLVIQERAKAVGFPLGIAFVTVETENEAKCIIDTFQPGTLRNWNMLRAPSPSDINWENLQISTRYWYSKAFIINAILFISLFFLTTPAIIVNMINTHTTVQENIMKSFSPILAEFVPTLLLLTMSAVLPVFVAYTDQWMSHWTKSKQNHDTMLKTFTFLLFMVLILPSLGLTSAQAFLESSLHTTNETLRWDCIFLPDKGAFFVNYVITSALIGTALELLRFPELAMYVWRLLLMRSSAEKCSLRKEILSVFPFGIHYAWSLLIFTVTTVYSLICPLITPFGMLYLILKHFVDKHNIYYVYKPITMCGEGQQIHASAVTMVRVAIFILQLTMAAFAVVRGGITTMSIITLLGLFSTLFFFFMLSPFPSCAPKQNNSIANIPEVHDQYIAPVLISSENLVHSDNGATSIHYGSSSINDFGNLSTNGESIA